MEDVFFGSLNPLMSDEKKQKALNNKLFSAFLKNIKNLLIVVLYDHFHNTCVIACF